MSYMTTCSMYTYMYNCTCTNTDTIYTYMYNVHTSNKTFIGAKEANECGQTLHTHTYTPKLSSRERYS